MENRSSFSVLTFEFRNSSQCLDLERRRRVRDSAFAGTFQVRDTAIQRSNQFAQFTNDLGCPYFHDRPPFCRVFRRESFQTSPQAVQRQ